jgi:hypothetical protein
VQRSLSLGSPPPPDFSFALNCLSRLLPLRLRKFDNGVRLRREQVRVHGPQPVRRTLRVFLALKPTDFLELPEGLRDSVRRRHAAISADGTVADADFRRVLAGFPVRVAQQNWHDATRGCGKLSPQSRQNQDSDIALKTRTHQRAGRLLQVLPFRDARHAEALRNPHSRVRRAIESQDIHHQVNRPQGLAVAPEALHRVVLAPNPDRGGSVTVLVLFGFPAVNFRGPVKPEVQGAPDFRHWNMPVNPPEGRDTSIRARTFAVITVRGVHADAPPADALIMLSTSSRS